MRPAVHLDGNQRPDLGVGEQEVDVAGLDVAASCEPLPITRPTRGHDVLYPHLGKDVCLAKVSALEEVPGRTLRGVHQEGFGLERHTGELMKSRMGRRESRLPPRSRQ